MFFRVIAGLFAVVALMGCEPEPEPELVEVEVEVIDLLLEPSEPLYNRVVFRAYAIYSDDSWQDVTEDVEWSDRCVVVAESGRRHMGECPTLGTITLISPGEYALTGNQAVAEYQGHTATWWLINPTHHYPR